MSQTAHLKRAGSSSDSTNNCRSSGAPAAGSSLSVFLVCLQFREASPRQLESGPQLARVWQAIASFYIYGFVLETTEVICMVGWVLLCSSFLCSPCWKYYNSLRNNYLSKVRSTPPPIIRFKENFHMQMWKCLQSRIKACS